MDIRELKEKLNKKHVRVKVPLVQAEAYAVSYAKVLKIFTNEVVNGFSQLAYSIFIERNIDNKEIVQDGNSKNNNFTPEDLNKPIRTRYKKKSNPKKPWEIVKAIAGVITHKTTNKENYASSLSALFDYYSGYAELLAKKWTDEEIANLYRYVNGKYKAEFPNISISSGYYNNIMQAVVNENFALIKSIPEEILKDIQVAVSQSIISGNEKELIKNLKRIKDVNETRAVFIARDQIHKAVESFKQVQNLSLGIEYYEWLTAEDERVSAGAGGHRNNNKRIFKYGSNEAIISHSLKRGYYYGKPGDRPNCRCVAVGVIPDIDEKIIRSPDGYGYIIKKIKD